MVEVGRRAVQYTCPTKSALEAVIFKGSRKAVVRDPAEPADHSSPQLWATRAEPFFAQVVWRWRCVWHREACSSGVEGAEGVHGGG